jgi:ADP-heptose:LPS heptosyltransferase
LLLSLQSTKGFDWVIDTEQSFGLSTCFACRLTPSDHLILGFYKHRGLQLLDSTFTVDRTRIHEFVAFKGLFEFASQHISILKLDKNPLNGLLPPLDQTDNCVVVIGGRQSKERAFALKDWVKIVNRYKKDYEHIILVGHHIDTKFAVELMVACPFIYFNYVGRITFGQTVDLIRSARQVVGVDSGLIHVASFFDRPTYAVFANERKAINWGPLGRNSEGVLVNQIRESS